MELPRLDKWLEMPCKPPVALGSAALDGNQVAAGWARDRAALVSCGAEKAALVEGYGQLRAKLLEIK